MSIVSIGWPCLCSEITTLLAVDLCGPLPRFPRTVEETNITLPDGSTWLSGAELRDNFHLTDYASADLSLARTSAHGRPGRPGRQANMSKLAPVPTNSSKGQKDVIMEGFAGDYMIL